ncbi:Partitioning defective 3 homolog [Geodia barretti]|uniref:Partitioning defective 3 homolog n=1 Tax=Geodia barretti TaxID=519541 RepID=A0AA35RCL5_GEOBA|nr:Partitioning defective 3 homolog [Geodia barretti]
MRIQVVFNSTPILVPCGDGHLTVGELIQKAILRFKKVVDKDPDDVIEVRSLRLADTGSFVDQDDEVAEVLEDREVVILDFEYVPRYVREPDPVGGASLSGDSALTPSSQAFSPMTLGDEASGSAHYHRQTNHAHSEGYVTSGEGGVSDLQYNSSEGERGGREERGEGGRGGNDGPELPPSIEVCVYNPTAEYRCEWRSGEEEEELGEEGEEEEEGEGGREAEELAHIPGLGASQDTELVVTGAGWEGEEEEEEREASQDPESPHLTPRRANWSSQVDSGYAPKSQESFSHSQPKSLEAYSTSQELSLQEGGALSGGGAEYPREYPNLTPSQSDTTPKRAGVPPEKKDEGASSRGSQRGGSYEFSPRGDKRSGSNSYSRIQRGTDGNFVMSPARSSTLGRPGEFSGSGGFGFERGPRGGEGSGRGGRDHYYHRDYRDGYGSYDNHEGYVRGHGFAGDFDRHPYPHPDWRRSYAGGEFDHASPYSVGGRSLYDLHHGAGGRYDRGVFRPSPPSGQVRNETRPHPDGRGAAVASEEPREDGAFGRAANYLHPGGYDPRHMMGGPSGYSLSQPVPYLGPPRSLHGPSLDHERSRLLPLLEREQRGSTQRIRGGTLDERRERAYSLDEEYDDDDDLDRKDHRASQTQLNPFKRDFRKSIFRDGAVFSNWMERVHEYGLEDEEVQNTVPMFEGGDVSQSQRTPSPQPPGEKERGEEESEEEELWECS